MDAPGNLGATPGPEPRGQLPSSLGLDDLITRHLDGGLDPDGQRSLARQLAMSSEARRTFVRYLRLEAALVRLGLAGQLTPVAGAPVSTKVVSAAATVSPVSSTVAPATDDVPAMRRRGDWRVPVTALAIVGALFVAITLASRPTQRPTAVPGDGDMHEMDRVAVHWLRVAHAPRPFDAEEVTIVADPTGDDIDGEHVAGPPAWLVAAMADEESAAAIP